MIGRGIVAVVAVLGALVTTAAPAGAEDGLDYKQFRSFESRVADDVGAFWAAWSREHGQPYQAPRFVLTPVAHRTASACGVGSAEPDEPDSSPAFYCPKDRTVYFASGWLYRAIYQHFGDFASAIAVAHEWAHHVQTLQKLEPGSVMAAELQADCWAGVWGHDADRRGELEVGDVEEAGKALFALGDYQYKNPDHHGTPRQRVRWLNVGLKSGDVGRCDP
jgi:predicted metalloprotease